jgi:hypothetical protein
MVIKYSKLKKKFQEINLKILKCRQVDVSDRFFLAMATGFQKLRSLISLNLNLS